MKLLKSRAGKVKIILYYIFFLAADIFFMLFIILITGSIIAGLVLCVALGFGIGILGGELEFREHLKMRHKNHFRKRDTEPGKIITFPAESGQVREE